MNSSNTKTFPDLSSPFWGTGGVQGALFKNYITIAFRNLWKNRTFSFINIFGLVIGIACSLLIFLFVTDELSYDRFHKDAGNIYRIVKDFINDDGSR
ncbi:MAG: ABC transporter permease, partial [Bacteroidota bacterium]|nr:ABC transporter permease [Bacteroidota bacterium]